MGQRWQQKRDLNVVPACACTLNVRALDVRIIARSLPLVAVSGQVGALNVQAMGEIREHQVVIDVCSIVIVSLCIFNLS